MSRWLVGRFHHAAVVSQVPSRTCETISRSGRRRVVVGLVESVFSVRSLSKSGGGVLSSGGRATAAAAASSWVAGWWCVGSPAVFMTNWTNEPLLESSTSLSQSMDYLMTHCNHEFKQVDFGTAKVLFFLSMMAMLLAARLGKVHTFAFTSKYNPSFLCVAHPSFMHLLPRNAGAVKKG